jgi:hypothetical protein
MPYHYVITVQGVKDGKLEVCTVDGERYFEPGTERFDAYRELLRDMKDYQGIEDPAVLFFSLEPNKL